MFTQLFGNYLLNKGLVTSSQLSAALAAAKQTRAKLGVLAINAGYMDAAQVDEVHSEQQRVDKRFGDIAVDKGYLSAGQVEELLSKQGHAHLALGQALVDSGAMSNTSFADALSAYKSENSLTDVDFDDKTGNKVDELIAKLYSFGNDENSSMCTEYVSLLFKNLIRFIGDDFTPLAPEKIPSARVSYCAKQDMKALGFSCTTAIDAAEQAFIAFASRFAGEQLTDVDEMTEAANLEFMNLHNGLFAVNLSNDEGREVSLLPPVALKNDTIDGPVYRISVVYPFGTASFYITA
ncbi:MAG: chemotaxis protein CheX [Oscillospiraceae bacterium]|nr:chemotaxis protein CheX [Oscillospiraceae bacterium]